MPAIVGLKGCALRQHNMRRIVVIAITLTFLINSMPIQSGTLEENPAHYSAPPSDGSTVTITDVVYWNGTHVLDGNVEISDNGFLFINGNITVIDGSSISTSNGNLRISDSNLTASTTEQSLQVKYQDGNVEIPLLEYGNNSITFHFADDVGSYGPGFDTQQNPTSYAQNTSHTVYFDSSGENSTIVNITHNPYYIPTITGISVVGPSGDTNQYNPAELTSSGLYYCCTHHWEINVGFQDDFYLDTSTLSGVKISVDGLMHASQSNIDRSAPIQANAVGNVTISESSFTRNLDDEDIRLEPWAYINWENSSGTGGFVDHWIRTVGAQQIRTNAGGSIITATNLGWLGLSKSGESDDYGMWDLEIPERIIELEDSTGQHWQEEAKIQATYNGAWGNFSTGIIDLDSTNHSYFHLNFSLPELSVDSITFDKTEQSVGSPVSATATVTNIGASAENVTLDCVLSGNSSDARISPAYPTVDVPSGETVEVSFTWREASTGESTLTCSILSPNGIYLYHEDLATSPKVEWQELFDASDGNTIVWVLMLSMGIGILLAAFIAIRQMNAIDEEADEEADEDEKDYAEIED